jgi:hypothetical protein
MKNKITNQALKIIRQYPIYEELPASISGKYHLGETLREHSELAVKLIKSLCIEFNVSEEDRDMLVATMYLHDIGNCVISVKGNCDNPNYKYYPTGFSRLNIAHKLHPILSALVIDKENIDRKQEIKRLVSIHMNHWYKEYCPQANNQNLFEYLVCTSDYLASKKNLFKIVKKGDKE